MSVFWSTWGTVALLILVWVTLQVAVSGLYELVKASLDRAIPDRLAQSAGDWLRDLVAHLGLSSSVMVTSARLGSDSNSYHPAARVICLDARTWHKHDPFFWATAAHELGHAIVHVRAPALGHLMLAGRRFYTLVGAVGRGLILGNLLFGSAEINDLALRVIQTGLALGALMVLDELLASGIALFLLRTHGRLRGRDLLSAALGLFMALATYLANVIGQLIFYLYFDFVADRIEREVQFVPGDALGTLGTVVLVIVSVLLIFPVLREVAALINTPRTREDHAEVEKARKGGTLFTSVLLCVFVALTWDLATSTTGQFLVCLALPTALALPFSLIGIAIGLLFLALGKVLVLPLVWLVDRFGDGEESEGLRERMASGDGISEEAHDAIALAGLSALASLPRRVLGSAMSLVWLPFVVWYWLS